LTWKDLQRLIAGQQQTQQTSSQLEVFRGKPFYFEIPGEHNHVDDCFNCTIGWPLKNNNEYPLFSYEKDIIDAIEGNQHVWIKKARGIGVTSLLLRYLAWSCLSSDRLEGKSIFLVSGTRENFSNDIKNRMEKLFERNFPDNKFESKYTELWLNKTWIKVFPTKRIQDLRGYTDVSYLWIDEADYFDTTEQNELEYVIKAYEEKSNCKIILVSTPYKPLGLFDRIEKNEIFKGFFKKIFLHYTLGLDKIYDSDFIEREKNEAYFEREYCLKYQGRVGNIFSLADIEKAVQLGEQYKHLDINAGCLHMGGIDPGFSSSVTAITICELGVENQVVRVILSEEHDKATPSAVADRIFQLHTEIPNLLWFVDSANRGFTNELKSKFGESLDWERADDVSLEDNYVIPVTFQKDHKSMLEWTYNLLAKGRIAIDPKYERLILSLKSAYTSKGEFDLDKDITIYSDYLDSLRLSLRGVKIKQQ
jgi:hypothetical protein